MKQEKKEVIISEEEALEYAEFKAKKAEEKKKEAAKEQRKEYRKMVDNEIDAAIPLLLSISEGLKDTKKEVMNNFRTILEIKQEVLKVTKDGQKTHTFTNSAGNKRISLGVYVTDGYRDTVEDGIAIVKEYIESLAGDDAKTKSLVSMVFRLLARDSKGTLKAGRVLQLRKMAEESKNERFMEGVQIIEEAYQPAISKQFVRAEVRDENGIWKNIPLGMTEA